MKTDRRSHIPQVHVEFSARRSWENHGRFERFALWPESGSPATFRGAHWTAYYRKREPSTPTQAGDRPACCQIFVCRGTLDLHAKDGHPRQISAGDFLCGMYSEAELEGARCSDDLFMVVKYQADNLATIDWKLRPQDDLSWVPYFYGHGDVNDFQSALLHGTPFGHPTNLAAVVRFSEGTVVSSHYHDEPIFHEFIYLQGGHLTPDGFYAPGDHVTSIPGCKEGPWLATYEPTLNLVPRNWPRFVLEEALAPKTEAPFPKPFANDHGEEVHGLLFVHGGPFVNLLGGINWLVIGANELGPKG